MSYRKILVAGKNSYIGDSFIEYMSQWRDEYSIDVIDMREDDWLEEDFSKYEIVYYVAGIAHCKEKENNKNLYYYVNTELALKVARKAKKSGCQRFIYLSSMSVYGKVLGLINKETQEMPNTYYGCSKLEAEQKICELEDDNYKIVVLRPPMVYGKGCKGNYQVLRNIVLRVHLFPNIKNERSMLYIDNLSSVVKNIIDNHGEGIFFPQNVEYVSTSEMASYIMKYNKKRIVTFKFLNPIVKFCIGRISIVDKVFGTLTYEKDMNVPEEWLVVKNFEKSIDMTEKN